MLIPPAGALVWLLGFLAHRPTESPAARLGERLKRYPRFAIHEFPDEGSGHVVGVVGSLGESLRSPFTGRDCLAYTLHARTRDKHGDWESLIGLADTVPFAIADDSGAATVMGAKQVVALHRDRGESFGLLNAPTPRVAALLDEHGHAGTYDVHLAEGVLLPGDRAVIMAHGRWVNDETGGTQAGYRAPARRLLLDEPPGDALAIGHATPRRITGAGRRLRIFDWPP